MKSLNFWRKFSHYLIILFSAVMLFAFTQQMVVSGNILKQGPEKVFADNDCQPDSDLGCANPGTEESDIFPTEPEPAAPPAGSGSSGGGPAAAAPSCDSNWNVSCCSGSDSLSCPNQSTFQSLGYEYWANEACSNKGGRTCSAPPPPNTTPPAGGDSSGGGAGGGLGSSMRP